MTLRLARLPDRTPVRIVLSVDPALAATLQDYAAVYTGTYGIEEKPETLIPAILETFLASDAGFKRLRRSLPASKDKSRTK